MGGVHPSFMPSEALEHADAVVVGEVEPVMPKILDDLESGSLKGIYKSEQRHSMDEMSIPRYDLVKKSKYLNSTFIRSLELFIAILSIPFLNFYYYFLKFVLVYCSPS